MKAGGRALLLLVLGLLIASCAAVEEFPYEASRDLPLKHITLSASFADTALTKTALNADLSVSWKEGDEITVFSGSEGYTFSIVSISEDGLKATFEGDIVPAETYYAVYPKDESASITEDGSILTTLPELQTAVASSFSNGANVSIAKSSNGQLYFMNVGSLASVSVGNDGIASATLSSDTVLAGPAAIAFVNGVPPVAVVDGSCSVTLTGGLAKGGKYYFVVYPGVHANGLKLTFTDEDGNRAIFENDKSCEFVPSGNLAFGSITIPDSKWVAPSFLVSSTIGVYDTEADLPDVLFNRLADQLVAVSDIHNTFRMQNLNANRYIEIYDVPVSYTVGDSFNVRVIQNYVESLDENYSEKVTVKKVENGLVWLEGASGKGYIIKQ